MKANIVFKIAIELLIKTALLSIAIMFIYLSLHSDGIFMGIMIIAMSMIVIRIIIESTINNIKSITRI